MTEFYDKIQDCWRMEELFTIEDIRMSVVYFLCEKVPVV
jgi:hypothetical protein